MRVNRQKQASLSQARLKEVLEYNSVTGEFIWIKKPSKYNSIRIGQIAGSVDNHSGYIQIGIDGNIFKAHRLVWLYVYGHFPMGDKPEIDHIDGNPSNNRLENLRESSRNENNRNQKMMSTNTSGVTGVHYKELLESSGKIYRYWVATWQDKNGKTRQKTFSIEKLGCCTAKAAALDFRIQQIQLLQVDAGITYSERHGIKAQYND